MIINKRIFFIFLPSLLILSTLLSCSSTNGIDDYFTFNTTPGTAFVVFSNDPVGQIQSTIASIPPDSSNLAKQGTTRELTKSLELTKLSFKFSDASYSLSDFDSISISVSADSLPDLQLAYYSGATGMVSLANADFALYTKKTSSHFSIAFKINKDPSTDEPVLLNFTFVYTARPLQ